MVKLQIPQHYESGLMKLRNLEEDSFQALRKALDETSPVFEPQKLAAILAPQVRAIPEGDIDEIVETLISLLRAQSYLDLSTTEIAQYVCEAMLQSENRNLRLDDRECAEFQERLISFFATESLTYPAKVSEVVSDHDHVYVRARVLTDLRAIFGPNIEEAPKGAAIVHVLRLVYRQGRKSEKFYVALDSQDLKSLISTLRRALSKEESLRHLLEAANIAVVKSE